MSRLALISVFAAAAWCGGFEDAARVAEQARAGNRTTAAIRLYRKAVELRPAWDEGWWYLGTLLYGENRYVEAADALRRFTRLKPETGAGWGLLGLCEFERRDYVAAAASLARAVDSGVGDDLQFTRLVNRRAAEVFTKLGKFETALRILCELKEMTPAFVRAAGLAALRMKVLPGELAADQMPVVDLAGRAALATAANDYHGARSAFETLMRSYGSMPNVHFLYGSFLIRQDPEAAMAEFRAELRLSPGHVPARVALALESVKQGNGEAAVGYAREAVSLAPDDFTTRYAYGRALLSAGRPKEAASELEDAARIRPDMPEAHFSLARCYQELGRVADAQNARAVFQKLTARTR